MWMEMKQDMHCLIETGLTNEKGNFIHIIFRLIFLVILPGYISLVDYTKQITPL